MRLKRTMLMSEGGTVMVGRRMALIWLVFGNGKTVIGKKLDPYSSASAARR